MAHLTSYSGTGAPVFGAQTSIGAKIESKVELVRHAKTGAEVVSSQKLLLNASVGIEDRIWLPGDTLSNVSVAKKPIRVDATVDRAGNALFWEVWL